MDYKKIHGLSEILTHGKRCIDKPVVNSKKEIELNKVLQGVYNKIHTSNGRISIERLEPPLVRVIDTYHKLSNFSEIT